MLVQYQREKSWWEAVPRVEADGALQAHGGCAPREILRAAHAHSVLLDVFHSVSLTLEEKKDISTTQKEV